MSGSDFAIEGDLPPKVPPKNYAVQMKSFRTAGMFGGKARKLVMEFVIVEPGEYFGKEIPKYYNVTRIIGRPQQGGRFKANPKGDFARDYFRLLQMGNRRLDRLPMRPMEGVTFLASVVTVTRSRGEDIPAALQYSKIGRLIRVLEGK